MCVTFGIVHIPSTYLRQTNFFPTDGTNIWFTEVLVHDSGTACSHHQGAAIFKDICSIVTWLGDYNIQNIRTIVMWLVDLNGFVFIFYHLRPTNRVSTLYMFLNIVVNKPYNSAVCSFNIVAVWGWLQVVAKTCRSTFVNQILVQAIVNKLVYMW